MYFVYYGVFWRFIGGLGVAYFSPGALVAGGGTGAEPWIAREWSSTAILYFSTAFLWWALVWDPGFGRWPWQKDGPWVVFCDLFWEGRPFSLMDKNGDGTFLRGIVTFLVTLALGLLLMTVLTQVFNAIWMEPYQGGQYTDGPDWRYIHMGEISGFCVLFAFIWKNYFNNFPNGLP
jgi:hypothetical protein